jgi:hypothetical protein
MPALDLLLLVRIDDIRHLRSVADHQAVGNVKDHAEPHLAREMLTAAEARRIADRCATGRFRQFRVSSARGRKETTSCEKP